MEKVFISYSHKDEGWKEKLRPHLDMLEKAGRLVVWDDRRIDGGENWYPEIKQAMDEAAVAVCLISANYLASDFIYNEEIPYLLERRQQKGILLLPVLIHKCLWQEIKWLKEIQMLPRDGLSIAEDFTDKEDVAFTEVAKRISDYLDGTYEAPEEPPSWPALLDNCIDIERLPKTGEEVFGRAKELAMLDDTWESAETHIISFVAWGGVGKSALVNKWVHQMTDDNYRGAEKVYAWSFYSQGTGHSVTSADMFVNNALHWFGDPKMAESKSSPWDKGKRLAELIQQQKTLLILDGLEPMQSDYEHDRGQVKDPALSVLIQQLAKSNAGLCIITTREWLKGISKDEESIIQDNLEQISPEAGRALLRVNGIRGTDAELEQATRDFGCNALAVNLLVAYLQDTDDRHIRNTALIQDLDIPEEDGKHPRRVMQALADRFGSSPELNVLHIMGLFDRPARAKEINWLRTREEVPDLTDRIRWLTDDDWNRIITNLRHFRLIAPESHHNKGGLDAHPHVREHFSQQLKEINEESFKQGHSHLYEFLKMSAPRLPNTLAEMEPLFAGVTHGCLAGRYQETFDDVYMKRVLRGNKFYNTDKIGALGADLAAISCFFEKTWREPASDLKEECKALVLNFAGFDLRALGRLRESAEPAEAALSWAIEQEEWDKAAMQDGSLSELYLTLGDVEKAVEYARKSVEYADISKDEFQRFSTRTTVADALHNSGKSAEAKGLFEEAEEMQKKLQPQYPYLYSLWGFRFCELLLSQGHYNGVQKRARQTLELAQQAAMDILSAALDNLSLGRAYMLEAVSQGKSEKGKGKSKGKSTKVKGKNSGWEAEAASLAEADDLLNKAVYGLREAGAQEFIVRGLLARAELFCYKRDFDRACGDFEEAKEISERGEMNRWLGDYHLEAARLCLAEGNRQVEAREHFEEAAKRVEYMGYHRRDPEVLLIQAELEIVNGDKKSARETLGRAKKRIDKMGCHRWDVEVERLKELLKKSTKTK